MPQRCQRCLASVDQLFECGRLSLCERCTAIAAQNKKKVKREGSKRAAVTSTKELRQLHNEAFAEYYKEQLSMSAEEWEEFERCLRSPLPVTWRFSGQGETALALCASMERRILPALEEQEQPSPLPWYPARLAWQTRVSRAALRGKDWDGAAAPGGAGRSDAVKALHAWLMTEQELGRVQRQEAVSMVPPLLLEVRRGMAVLDMCASPGSKTQQLLEALATAGGDGDGEGGGGLVVANDAHTKRCHMLASRAARLNSPGLVVLNHDARLLPEQLGDKDRPCPEP